MISRSDISEDQQTMAEMATGLAQSAIVSKSFQTIHRSAVTEALLTPSLTLSEALRAFAQIPERRAAA
jgi:hypothetical protein